MMQFLPMVVPAITERNVNTIPSLKTEYPLRPKVGWCECKSHQFLLLFKSLLKAIKLGSGNLCRTKYKIKRKWPHSRFFIRLTGWIARVGEYMEGSHPESFAMRYRTGEPFNKKTEVFRVE